MPLRTAFHCIPYASDTIRIPVEMAGAMPYEEWNESRTIQKEHRIGRMKRAVLPYHAFHDGSDKYLEH